MATEGPVRSHELGDPFVSNKDQCCEGRVPVMLRRTGAQLERKRMQDRKSQRNIRERNKQHIANLEEKLARLQSSTCLADLLEENHGLRQKVEKLESALQAIVEIAAKQSEGREHRSPPDCRSPTGSQMDDDPAAANLNDSAPPAPALPIEQGSNNNGQHDDSVIDAASKEGPNQPEPTGLAPASVDSDETDEVMIEAHGDPTRPVTPDSPTQAAAILSFWTGPFCHDISSAPELGADAITMAGPLNTDGGESWTPYLLSEPQPLPDGESEPAFFFNADDLVNADIFDLTGGLLGQELPRATECRLPTPQNCPPSNIWDVKIFKCISEHQSKLETASMGTPKDPELRILLHPHGNHTSTDSLTRFLCPPISQWNFELPEKLAIFWLNYIHLEYRISPTDANFGDLPPWLHPRPSQCQISHPIYIDTLPWPQLREKLILEYRSYPFNAFIPIFCYSLNVNWPYDHALTYVCEASGTIRLSSAFKTHLRKLEIWTLKPAFADSYPDLSLSVTIK